MNNVVMSVVKGLTPNFLKKAIRGMRPTGDVPTSSEDPGELSSDTVQPDTAQPDAYLISFPKSGRTWLRLMVGYAFVKHFGLQSPDIETRMINLTSLADLHAAIPRIKARHEDAPDKVPSEQIPRSKEMYRDTDVILLVRDPRDIAVSNHFQRIREAAQSQRWHGTEQRYTGTMQESIRAKIGGIESILHYYDLWAASKHVPRRILIVRYEDLGQNGERELKRVLDFFGICNVSPDIITEAVRYASFDNMRKLELTDGLKSETLRPGDPENPDTYKTRKGVVGDYLNHFTPDDIEYVNELMKRSEIATFGYTA
jgi:hypothetical protein